MIISLVGTDDQNREIVFGMEGLSALEKNQTTLFVMSTLDPNAIKDLADDIKAETNMTVISAPVSGGASGAKDETLSVMTSGDKDAIDRFMPQLEAISANVFYFGGDVSQSQAAKLSNNLILGIVMNGVAEAFRLADYYDLPEDKVLSLF